MGPKWSSLELAGNVITIQDDVNDHERCIPVDTIENWDVNWMVEGGALTVRSRDRLETVIVFPEGDYGQACADAISDLFLAFKPRKEEE